MKRRETKSGQRIIQVLSGRSNVFLVTSGEKNILIDTSPKYLWNLLQKRLKKLNVINIDYLILTHSHFDHSANSRRIKDKYKAQVIIHREEAEYLATGKLALIKGTNFYSRLIVGLLAKRLVPRLRFETCKYDILADSYLDLKDFGFNAYIMHTPGHTNGSLSVIVDNEIALVGDAMFGVFRRTVFPPFANNVKQMIESWGRLLDTGCSVFIPSHGSANNRSLVQKDYSKRIRSFE